MRLRLSASKARARRTARVAAAAPSPSTPPRRAVRRSTWPRPAACGRRRCRPRAAPAGTGSIELIDDEAEHRQQDAEQQLAAQRQPTCRHAGHAGSRLQQVAEPAQRDELRARRRELLAQPVHHHFDRLVVHVGFAGKDQLEQPLLRHRVAGLGQQGAQQRGLARRQLHRLAVPVDRAAARRRSAGRRTPGPSPVRRAATAPPCQGAHARFQLVEVERLGQVVVGAGVEAEDAVAHRAARGEDQHRRVAARARAPAPAPAGRRSPAGSGRAPPRRARWPASGRARARRRRRSRPACRGVRACAAAWSAWRDRLRPAAASCRRP